MRCASYWFKTYFVNMRITSDRNVRIDNIVQPLPQSQLNEMWRETNRWCKIILSCVTYTARYLHIDGIRDTGRRLTSNVFASFLVLFSSTYFIFNSEIELIVPNELISRLVSFIAVLNILTHFVLWRIMRSVCNMHAVQFHRSVWRLRAAKMEWSCCSRVASAHLPMCPIALANRIRCCGENFADCLNTALSQVVAWIIITKPESIPISTQTEKRARNTTHSAMQSICYTAF